MSKNIKIIFSSFLFLLLLFSCDKQKSNKPDDWNKEELNSWFDDGSWKGDWNATADESLDKKTFAVQYSKNSKLWEKAFTFLREKDLVNLEPGRYDIEGEKLYAIVLEYSSKDKEDTNFEAHKKYADIQYVIKGEELIGVTDLGTTKELIPYDIEKDIAFFTTNKDEYKVATNKNYFIFFPHNSHRPSIKVGENSEVKKIVLKVQLN